MIDVFENGWKSPGKKSPAAQPEENAPSQGKMDAALKFAAARRERDAIDERKRKDAAVARREQDAEEQQKARELAMRKKSEEYAKEIAALEAKKGSVNYA